MILRFPRLILLRLLRIQKSVVLAVSIVLLFTFFFIKLHTLIPVSSTNGYIKTGNSVFDHINDKKQFIKQDLRTKCLQYFDTLYENESSWTNFYANHAATAERLRMYDVCFMNPVLNRERFLLNFEDVSARYKRLENRMFPFLEDVTGIKPIITTLHGEEVFPWGPENPEKEKFSYWHNFQYQFKGKGIVLTIGDDHVPYTIKLLRTLDYLNNTLPIQIVNKYALSSASLTLLREKTPKSQQMFLVDAAPMFDSQWNFQRFANKWVPLLFSSFQEIVFIDADVISYVKPEVYLDDLDTKDAFYKDRYLSWIPGEKDICSSSISTQMPSDFEVTAFSKHHTVHKQYGRNYNIPDVLGKQNPTSDESLLRDFFGLGLYHHVESGLFTMTRSRANIMPVIMGLLMHTLFYSPCSHGDKEYMWQSKVVMNYKFNIVNSEASIAGTVETDPETQVPRVCGTQLAHLSPHGSGLSKLQWINGGLEVCKHGVKEYEIEEDVFITDFEEFSFSIFKEQSGAWAKPQTEAELLEYYSSAVSIAGVIEPSPRELNEWTVPDKRCHGYHYCLIADGNPGRTFYEFNGEEKDHIKNVGSAWIQPI